MRRPAPGIALITLIASAGVHALRTPRCHARALSPARHPPAVLGLFPADDESLLGQAASGAEQFSGGALFPNDELPDGTYVDSEGRTSTYTVGSTIGKDRSINEYTDRTKTKARMARNVYEEMKEGVPVNRAAKRAIAKKKKKKKKEVGK